MKRVFDIPLLLEVTKDYKELPIELIGPWVENKSNVMMAEGNSVGLATYEYPGLYSVHWFFSSDHRGRKAINLAKEMVDYLFQECGAKALRGFTKIELKAARWAARQLGLKSYGVLEFPNGPCELFCITKEEYYKDKE